MMQSGCPPLTTAVPSLTTRQGSPTSSRGYEPASQPIVLAGKAGRNDAPPRKHRSKGRRAGQVNSSQTSSGTSSEFDGHCNHVPRGGAVLHTVGHHPARCGHTPTKSGTTSRFGGRAKRLIERRKSSCRNYCHCCQRHLTAIEGRRNSTSIGDVSGDITRCSVQLASDCTGKPGCTLQFEADLASILVLVPTVGLAFRPSGHCSYLGWSFPTCRFAAAYQGQERSDALLAGYILLLFESAPDFQHLAPECVVKRKVARSTTDQITAKTACSMYLRSPTLPLEWGSAYQHIHSSHDARQSDSARADFLRQRQR